MIGDAEVELSLYGRTTGHCYATLRLDRSRLSSLRFAPRPADVLAAVRSALEHWRPETCSLGVALVDDRSDTPWEEVEYHSERYRWDGAEWRLLSSDSEP